jgi:hypothetical protein
MKKIIISVFALLTLTSSNMVDDWATIYCKPDLNKCISNLKHQLLWLDIDYEAGAINKRAYESYKLVAENTLLSIEMILNPKGCQCDTTGKKDRYKLPK